MKKLNLPWCPYCKAKLWYLETFRFKNKSHFICPNCKRKSEVILNSNLFKLLETVEIISMIIFAIVIFKSGGYCLLGLIFVTLIFALFYLLSPFFISLAYFSDPIEEWQEKSSKLKKQKDYESNANEDTSKEIFSN